jgi:hypothetical protein
VVKIIILGDLHGEFHRLNCLIEQEQPDIILQVGDFGYWPRMEDQDLSIISSDHTRIYFCDGNNDDLDRLLALAGTKVQPVQVSPNIYYMPRGSVLELDDGRRVLFIGGAQSIDRFRRYEGWDWFPEEILCEQDLSSLPEGNIDIVVSHTCPLEFSMETFCRLKSNEVDPSRQLLSRVLYRYQPAQWYFGHWHIHARGEYGPTKWEALGWSKEWTNWYRVLP